MIKNLIELREYLEGQKKLALGQRKNPTSWTGVGSWAHADGMIYAFEKTVEAVDEMINWSKSKSTKLSIPGTLETPPVTLEAPVVDELPDGASIGDLVTFNGNVLVCTGMRQWTLLTITPPG